MKAKELKKDIVFSETLRGFDLTFHTTWGLFSPRKIDEGTRLLINCLEIQPEDDCLDLGCGYGAIGLVMARLAPRGKTLLVDKDFVALNFAKKNAGFNNITNCQCILSNGFEAVSKKDHSIIASNLPANVGRELLYLLLSDAKKHLRKSGKIYLVTISGLKHFIARNLMTIFSNSEKVKQGRAYTVWVAKKM